MKASVYLSRTNSGAISPHLTAMCAGLERHGISVSRYERTPDLNSDFVVCWGWRKGDAVRRMGFRKPILVMERGYFPDRFEWTSIGWDGLNGRARWNAAQDRGERFWANWGGFAKEWEKVDGYYLIIGQVIGDAALTMVDFNSWVKRAASLLEAMGMEARYRPHPIAAKRGQFCPLPDRMIIGGTLEDALSGAACAVTFNSNTSTDAVLAGVPAITYDEGAMAWPVTSHDIIDGIVTPDRSEWFRDMAWKQWTMGELSSGFAWEIAREAM